MAVLVFGSNDMYQIALPESVVCTSKPTELDFFKDKEVLKVACGRLHVLILTSNNQLYSWGVNDDGALGRDGDESKLALVDFKGTVVDICAGASYSALLTDKGRVYVCGTFKSASGILGLTPHSRMEYKFVELENIEKITKIFAGKNHIIMIDKYGSLWAVGANESGQLGRQNRLRHPRRCLVPLRISAAKKRLPDTVFISAAGGGYHSVAVNRLGCAYSWGSNLNGELGTGSTVSSSQKNKVLLENIKDIGCGENFTIFLTENKELYGVGDNTSSQLAQKGDHIVPLPRLILANVERAAAGRDFCLAQIGNKILGWGLNMSGEVGNDERYVSEPTEINFDFGEILDIKCGGEFSVVITK